jgi:NADPH:quinone reductase-like Zn-dependent oxidoreductase
MKAIYYKQYGDLSQLEEVEIDRPKLTASQVLVKVEASAINPIDWKLLSGSFRYIMPVKFPAIPGFDLAGEVVETGAAVTQFTTGDKVYACQDIKQFGTAAEYTVVEEHLLDLIAEGLSAGEAAGIPLAGLTALQGLRNCGGLNAGERVLIVGGSGGVGHYAVQIAKAMDTNVTAVCSTGNVEMVRDLGADTVIDYNEQTDFATDMKYDVVLDCVVNSPYKAFVEVMQSDAVYIPALPSISFMIRSYLMPLYTKRRVKPVMLKTNGKDLNFLSNLVREGKLRTIIDSSYSLNEYRKAFERNQTGRTRGKIIINI